MKARRQNQLLQIVREQDVETQEELMQHLRHYGFKVTQATISRDIKELRLAKVSNGKGGYKYALPSGTSKGDLNRRAKRIFEDYVRDVDFSGNLIVIKTYPGGANAVAAIIDEMEWSGMIGSIAGDDSILLITRTEKDEQKHRPLGITGRIFDKIQALLEG